MKTPLTIVSLALLGWVLSAPVAHAQTVTAVPSDIIVGFEATGGTGASTNFEIDLGKAANLTAGTVVPNLNAALTAIYGSNWAKRSDLYWGIMGEGGINTAPLVWASNPETTPGTQSTPWNHASSGALANPRIDISGMYTGNTNISSLNAQPAYSGFTNAAAVDSTQSGSWTLVETVQPGEYFDFFTAPVEAPMTAITGAASQFDGSSYAVLDLYVLSAGSISVPAPLVGSFGLNSAGNLVFETNPTVFTPVNPPPVITFEPANIAAGAGQTAVLSVSATGTGTLTYQWDFNGAPISGATDAYLVLSDVQAANAGGYTCTVTNVDDPLTSTTAYLTVGAGTDLGRIINLSIRDNCGTGADQLIAGFVIGGAGNDGSAKTLLVRAGGPVLTPYGVTGVLPDPNLAVHQLSSGGADLGVVASNDNWGGDATVISTATQVGAFAYPDSNSLDSALVTSLTPGAYTANITGNNNGTGVALAELYDATTSFTSTTPRLINVSGRAQVANGAASLIAGFVIGGSTEKTVLVRGLGPVLANYGVTGVLADPQLEVHKINSDGSDGGVIASNSAWGGDTVLTAIFTQIGASPLSDPASADCALLVSLPPGVYTANVTSASGGTGDALVEVYEVP